LTISDATEYATNSRPVKSINAWSYVVLLIENLAGLGIPKANICVQ
jgi:hypothetical protein